MSSEQNKPNCRLYNRDLVNEAIQYLQNGTIPQRYLNPNYPNYKTRFKQRWDPFKVIQNKLYLEHRQVIPEEDVNSVIQKLWDDPSQRILGVSRFHARLLEQYVGISRSDTDQFLKNQETKQLHSTVHHQKVVRPILPKAPRQVWQMDLADMTEFAGYNGQKKYLLTIIDCFTKYVYVFALSNKNEQTISAKLDELFSRDKPKTIQSDNGSEFKNQVVLNTCNQHQVKQVFALPYKPQSQGMIERFNQTIKRLIYAYMTEKRTKRYIDVLTGLVDNYNSSIHSTIKAKPVDVHGLHLPIDPIKERIKQVGIKPILEQKKILPNNIVVGDSVRVALRTTSERRREEKKGNHGYIQQFSLEIYTVRQIKNPREPHGSTEYYLNNSQNEPVNRRYYRKDLLKIDSNKLVRRPANPQPAVLEPNQPGRNVPNRVRNPNPNIFNQDYVF